LINKFCLSSITVVQFGVSIERVHLQFCKLVLGVNNVLKWTLFMENLNECYCSGVDITALLNFGSRYCFVMSKQNILELYIIL